MKARMFRKGLARATSLTQRAAGRDTGAVEMRGIPTRRTSPKLSLPTDLHACGYRALSTAQKCDYARLRAMAGLTGRDKQRQRIAAFANEASAQPFL